MANDSLSPGSPLADGRFVITGTIASGGQATTYEGIDKSSGQRVAIKRFSVRGASSWKEVELAEREARVLSGLTHPGLPKVVSHFEEQGALYLVLEYIEGSTLDQLRNQHELSQDDVVDYLLQVSDILEYLHAQSPPIVHRDIKPRNLIRRPDGKIVLVDFGSVRDRLKPEGGSTVVGTFGYMAPEQFQGRAMLASDTYGAAATALALLTGRDPDQLPHKGLQIDVEQALANTVRPELRRFLVAALDPNPDVRPASVRQSLDSHRVSRRRDESRAADLRGSEEQARERRRAREQSARQSAGERDYADFGEAPFQTPGYHRNRARTPHGERQRARQQARAERHRARQQARAERQRHPQDVDIETPFAEALAIPEIRRALRIPVVGLVVLMLLVVLRTVLWFVLGVGLPRFLKVLQKVTGTSLDDAVEQTTSVGQALRDQLTRVTTQVRPSDSPKDGPPEAGTHYRVAPPQRPSRIDEIATNFEQRAHELEEEMNAAAQEWDRKNRR